MLKEDLERLIEDWWKIDFIESLLPTKDTMSKLAQAIIDRLEIDEEKTEKILRKTKLTIKTTRKKCPLCGSRGDITYWEGGIATAIAMARPIKLK